MTSLPLITAGTVVSPQHLLTAGRGVETNLLGWTMRGSTLVPNANWPSYATNVIKPETSKLAQVVSEAAPDAAKGAEVAAKGLPGWAKPVGIGLAIAAAVGGFLLWNSQQTTQYIVKFSAEPDYSETTPEKFHMRLQEHFNTYGVPIQRELEAMKAEGLVTDYWAGDGALNGFLVDIKNGKHEEVGMRLAQLPQVGEMSKASLNGE